MKQTFILIRKKFNYVNIIYVIGRQNNYNKCMYLNSNKYIVNNNQILYYIGIYFKYYIHT